jgi:putative oxidoreductase
LFSSARILLGLMFVIFGANLLHPFMPMTPPPAGSPPAQFMGVMAPSGWMHSVGFFQLVGGLLVLVGGTAPLGLCILGPIIVNILIFHIQLAGGQDIAPGLVAAVLEIILIYAYRASFIGLLTTKARPVV